MKILPNIYSSFHTVSPAPPDILFDGSSQENNREKSHSNSLSPSVPKKKRDPTSKNYSSLINSETYKN